MKLTRADKLKIIKAVERMKAENEKLKAQLQIAEKALKTIGYGQLDADNFTAVTEAMDIANNALRDMGNVEHSQI